MQKLCQVTKSSVVFIFGETNGNTFLARHFPRLLDMEGDYWKTIRMLPFTKLTANFKWPWFRKSNNKWDSIFRYVVKKETTNDIGAEKIYAPYSLSRGALLPPPPFLCWFSRKMKVVIIVFTALFLDNLVTTIIIPILNQLFPVKDNYQVGVVFAVKGKNTV